MEKLFSIFSLVIITASFFVAGCSKDEDPIPPTVTFKQADGYVSANTSANYGDTPDFGITAKSNGTDNLAKSRIYANGQQLLDSTVNSGTFIFDFFTVKTIMDKEVWKFIATDIAGNLKTDSIVITGHFSDILTI